MHPSADRSVTTAGHDVVDIDETTVARILIEEYGIEAQETAFVSGEAAAVCRVATTGGPIAVKLSRATPEERAVIQWQGEMGELLVRSGLPVAALRRASDGRLTVSATIGGVPLVVQVNDWLPGTPLAELRADAALLRDLGRTAAGVQNALRHAPPPPRSVGHPWDLARSHHSVRTSLPAIRDARANHLLARAADRFEAEVLPLVPVLPRAVVHHDLHDFNVLASLDSEGRMRVSGIIDLGDMIEGLRIAELAVAAAYAVRPQAAPVAALYEVAAGWGTAAPLDEREVRVLFPAMIARIAVNAAVWATRVEGPRAAYALARSAGSLGALERLLDVPTSAVIGALETRMIVSGTEG